MQKLKRIKEDIKSPHPIAVINSSVSLRAAFLSVSSPRCGIETDGSLSPF